MTHDELVKFAAEKVGGEVCNPTGDELCVKTLFATLDPTMCSGWHIHDLTSPDLFFKGLGVFHEQHKEEGKWHILVQRDGSLEYNLYVSETRFYTVRNIKDVSEIPQKFWECWAEAEGKGNLTKEGA